VSKSKELKAPEMAPFPPAVLAVQLRQSRSSRPSWATTRARRSGWPAPTSASPTCAATPVGTPRQWITSARPSPSHGGWSSAVRGREAHRPAGLGVRKTGQPSPTGRESRGRLRALELRGGLLRDHPADAPVPQSAGVQLPQCRQARGRPPAGRGFSGWRGPGIREDECARAGAGRDNLDNWGNSTWRRRHRAQTPHPRPRSPPAAAPSRCTRLAEQHPDESQCRAKLADA